MESIDIAIISQFRSELLKKCLDSLNQQKKTLNNVIVVLHPDDYMSRNFVRKFKGLKLIMKFYKGKSYALLRNIALKTAKSDYVYFLDDDCVISKKVVERASKYLKSNKHYSAVQGKTINYDTSFYSQVAQWTNDLWVERLWDKKKKTLKSIDTKNVCFRKKAVKDFSFFECFGSEDVDFGLQISESGGLIGFDPQMLVYHHEQADTLIKYFTKRIRMAKGLRILKRKWGKLPIFYQGSSDFSKKIKKKFRDSNYRSSLKYRTQLEVFLLARNLRFFLEGDRGLTR